MLALSEEPNPTVFQKTLGLNDFYFGTDGFDFPMGNIQMVGKSTAEMYRGEKPLETTLAPERTLRNIAEHAVDFWLSTEDLPSADNRVTLDDQGRVHLAYTPANEGARDRLYHQLKSMLGDLGMHPHHLVPRHAYLKTAIPVAGVAHQAGTCRFGDDPDSSALDPNCRAHELDNLYVVDTSFFPSISAVNPALTAMANALRVGDHLLERMGVAERRAGRGRLTGQPGSRPPDTIAAMSEPTDRGATAWRAPPPHSGPDDRDPPGGRERNPRHPAAAAAGRPPSARRGMGRLAGNARRWPAAPAPHAPTARPGWRMRPARCWDRVESSGPWSGHSPGRCPSTWPTPPSSSAWCSGSSPRCWQTSTWRPPSRPRSSVSAPRGGSSRSSARRPEARRPRRSRSAWSRARSCSG